MDLGLNFGGTLCNVIAFVEPRYQSLDSVRWFSSPLLYNKSVQTSVSIGLAEIFSAHRSLKRSGSHSDSVYINWLPTIALYGDLAHFHKI